jgi:protein ImuB
VTRRFVSIWLPFWPTDRWQQKRPTDGRPLVLTTPGPGGPRLAAVDAKAAAENLHREQSLADARALVPQLRAADADPAADAAGLARLAEWCSRYTPWAACDGEDGLMLDISGCAHLFDGEAALAGDIVKRLARAGVSARAAIADTPAASWAWARHGEGAILAAGEAETKLRSLPIAALRLPQDIADGLWRLGLRRIGHLFDLPRAPLARRFGAALLQRLDRARGIESEPIDPRRPAPQWRVRMTFPDGIGTRGDIDAALDQLLKSLGTTLENERLGVRRLETGFYRLDGTAQFICIGTSQPTRDVRHLHRLFAERLDGVAPGFGIETMILEAQVTEPLVPRQTVLATASTGNEGVASVIDRLQNRLGRRAVFRAALQESHSPERAAVAVSAMARTHAVAPAIPPRPVRLFTPPEPIEAQVLAGAAPQRFRWRRVEHRVTASRGPERIGPEWWRPAPDYETRDYFWLQDGEGRRFWVYRVKSSRAWFLHGLFA